MNNRLLAPTIALLLMSGVACVEDVGKDNVAAKVEAPQTAKAEGEAAKAPKVVGTPIAVDTAKSKVHALGAKITAKHPIEFDKWEGTLHVHNNALTGVEVTIQMDSLRADADRLTSHLKSADFFDIAQFPTASFKSSKVVKAAEGAKGTHTMSGDLTLHGVTQQITFPITVQAGEGAVQANSTFVINRKDFGIVYPGKPDDLIQDNVVLTIDLAS